MWRLFQLFLSQIFHNPSYLKIPHASTAVCIFYKCATWQMRNQEFCILEIRKCTLTNTQLCTLTNTHPCSWQMHNCGPRWQIRNCQAISQDLTSLSSWWHRRAKIKYFQKSLQWKALNLPSAIPFDKWVRQYGVPSWNTLNRLPIKLECFRTNFSNMAQIFIYGVMPKSPARNGKRKCWQVAWGEIFAESGGNIFAKMQQIHRSQQSKKLLTVNLKKNRQTPAHNCWQWTWESERHISSRGGRVTLECNTCERAYNHVRQTRARVQSRTLTQQVLSGGGRVTGAVR